MPYYRDDAGGDCGHCFENICNVVFVLLMSGAGEEEDICYKNTVGEDICYKITVGEGGGGAWEDEWRKKVRYAEHGCPGMPRINSRSKRREYLREGAGHCCAIYALYRCEGSACMRTERPRNNVAQYYKVNSVDGFC